MREPQSITIDGWRYVVRPLPAGQGLVLMARVGKLLGSSLVTLASGGGEGAALASIVDRIQPTELVEIARELAATTTLAQPGAAQAAELATVFDQHFAGDYLALLDWVKFAAEVNYGPFVAGLRRRGADRADARKAAVAPSP